MKLKAPQGVGDPCVAGVAITPRDGVYEVEAEIGALLIECFGFVEVEAAAHRDASKAAPAAPRAPGRAARQDAEPRGSTHHGRIRSRRACRRENLAVGLERHRLVRRHAAVAPDHRCQRRDHGLSRPRRRSRRARSPNASTATARRGCFCATIRCCKSTSLVIDNVALPAAPRRPPARRSASGYLLEAWDGLPPGRPQALDLFRAVFRNGRQNVVVGYSAGYAVESEAASVPASPGPYTVTAAAPFGPLGERCRRHLCQWHGARGGGRHPAPPDIMYRPGSIPSPRPMPAQAC